MAVEDIPIGTGGALRGQKGKVGVGNMGALKRADVIVLQPRRGPATILLCMKEQQIE